MQQRGRAVLVLFPEPSVWLGVLSFMATLDHIGIAVTDLPGMKRLLSLLGLNVEPPQAIPEQNVVAHFVPLPANQSRLELLEPLHEQGPIAQFVQKRGPGIHHLSFSVRKGELEPLCVKLRAEGYRVLYDQPRSGAHQMKINFIHPSSAGGILIEVMEPG